MTAGFRTKLFAAALSSAVIALAVAGVLFAQRIQHRADAQIQNTLVAEARLVAELVERSASEAGAPSIAALGPSAAAILSLERSDDCPNPVDECAS